MRAYDFCKPGARCFVQAAYDLLSFTEFKLLNFKTALESSPVLSGAPAVRPPSCPSEITSVTFTQLHTFNLVFKDIVLGNDIHNLFTYLAYLSKERNFLLVKGYPNLFSCNDVRTGQEKYT